MTPAQMIPGTVVFDPHAKVPANQSFFTIVEVHDPEIGPWVLEQVAGGTRRTIHLPVIDELEVPEPDGLFSELIGADIKLHMTFGSRITGRLERVEVTSFKLDGELEYVATGFVVDEELYPIDQVEALDVL